MQLVKQEQDIYNTPYYKHTTSSSKSNQNCFGSETASASVLSRAVTVSRLRWRTKRKTIITSSKTATTAPMATGIVVEITPDGVDKTGIQTVSNVALQ